MEKNDEDSETPVRPPPATDNAGRVVQRPEELASPRHKPILLAGGDWLTREKPNRGALVEREKERGEIPSG